MFGKDTEDAATGTVAVLLVLLPRVLSQAERDFNEQYHLYDNINRQAVITIVSLVWRSPAVLAERRSMD